MGKCKALSTKGQMMSQQVQTVSDLNQVEANLMMGSRIKQNVGAKHNKMVKRRRRVQKKREARLNANPATKSAPTAAAPSFLGSLSQESDFNMLKSHPLTFPHIAGVENEGFRIENCGLGVEHGGGGSRRSYFLCWQAVGWKFLINFILC